MNITPRFWSGLTWLFAIAAVLAAIAWVLTRAPATGWLTLMLLAATLAAAYVAAGDLKDELSDWKLHPLDSYPEQLRRRVHDAEESEAAARRIRLAMHPAAQAATDQPADDERTERGW